MTTRTWNGSSDAFSNGADWSPAGVPTSGDIAIINSGTVTVASTPSGVAIQLNEALGAAVASTLNLANVTLDASAPLTVRNNQTQYTAAAPTINVTGTSTLAGTESFYGSRIQFTIGGGAALVNAGTMNFYSSSPVISGAGSFVNNGTLALVNPGGGAQIPVFGTAVTGTGQIALGTKARIEFDGAVGSGQTVVFNDGASGNEIAQFNAVGSFGGTINGFSQSDLLAIINVPYSGATYTSTGANSGTLNLYSGATLEGSLNFVGAYSLGSFNINPVDLGGGQSNLQITTSVTNAVSAGLPSGYANGGNGNTVAAVYRFFDTRYGTHFFTSDAGEKNTVLATRPDLVEETNGFGDVAPTDPNATAVYRFFDTNYGTHFFTSNAGERDTILATRPDLTYEPNSTFYEHTSQQAGDTAVYRLFDTKTGTQFLTGDQGEYNGITTPGASTYRPDLRSEGVAFYAPVGSFT